MGHFSRNLWGGGVDGLTLLRPCTNVEDSCQTFDQTGEVAPPDSPTRGSSIFVWAAITMENLSDHVKLGPDPVVTGRPTLRNVASPVPEAASSRSSSF